MGWDPVHNGILDKDMNGTGKRQSIHIHVDSYSNRSMMELCLLTASMSSEKQEAAC